MEIRVPLSHFLDHLKSVKEKSRRWVNLDEVEFLLNNFSFDDSTVTYSPMREHYSLGNVMTKLPNIASSKESR